MTNWKEIHLDFTLELQKEWEELRFSYEQCKEWVDIGLKPEDADFAKWLRNTAKETPKNILNYGINDVKKNLQGLLKRYTNYLNNSNSKVNLNYKESEKYKYIGAQEWLSKNYPNKQGVEIIKLEDYREKISGGLVIDGFPQLKRIQIKENNLTKLQVTNCPQLIGLYCKDNQINELNISGIPNLKWLNCSRNLLTSLNLSDYTDLEYLNYEYNQLVDIDLSNNRKLKTLGSSSNRLTDLTLTNNLQLEKLHVHSNNFSVRSLDFLSHLVNLELLVLNDNSFVGSLKPLRNLVKLEKLDISNTNISHGLEYLPDSVKSVTCVFNNIDSRVSDIWDELQSFEGEIIKWRETKIDKKLSLMTSPLIPSQLIGENKQKNEFAKLVEKGQVQNQESKLMVNTSEFNYSKIHFSQWKEIERNKISSFKQLPTRLYNIQEDKVEETRDSSKIKNYAILSYVWGNPNIKITPETKNCPWWKQNLTVSGNKSLQKSIQACKLLGIDYIWVDQLCIIQDGEKAKKDKENEIPKMRQYYSNGEATLVAMNSELGNISSASLIEILSKIINSEWFARSWTFQEGWLSKHTIFMFDDKLIDGWAMAGIWVLNQSSYTNVGKYNSRSEFNKGTKKIATPVGWTYFRDGYDESDKVEMTLNQALKAIKNRGRSVPVDGVYSILGLLPYGEKIKVDYSISSEKALENVMRIATENYHIEPLAWHGEGSSFFPKVDKHGSASVKGGIDIKLYPNVKGHYPIKIDYWNWEDKKSIILFSVDVYNIVDEDRDIYELEGGFEIEKGLYKKSVKVKLELMSKEPEESEYEFKKRRHETGEGEIIDVSLFGIQEKLDEAKEGNSLVLFNRKGWRSDKPFALLVKKSEEKYIHDLHSYHEYQDNEKERNAFYYLGLVELGNEEKLVGDRQEIIMILNKENQNKKLTEENSQDEYYSQIPPKQNQLSEQIALFGQEETIDPQIINPALKWIKVNQENLEEINNLQNNLDKLERLKEELRDLQTNVEISPKK
ncbi:MAG: HET domain-containing protein [Candidatus Moeniiplasma glomeromycotorum]|nr:HET domain-containing protein [Candidatus Moeniiplasma glomeromycotorum]MCE8169320.1 HET domain-containing protein [Candidatus Moeniiplasma glomeromycotorum]